MCVYEFCFPHSTLFLMLRVFSERGAVYEREGKRWRGGGVLFAGFLDKEASICGISVSDKVVIEQPTCTGLASFPGQPNGLGMRLILELKVTP